MIRSGASTSPGRQLVLSQYHVGPRYVESYASALRRWQPQVLDGYTSNLVELARLFKENDVSLSIPLVVTTCETLTPGARRLLEEVFGGRVQDKYGTSENVALALECSSGTCHIFQNVGVIEVVDEDGQPVPNGQRGRLLLTTVNNDLMPLVRYDVGDMGAVAEADCPCGRTTPILKEIAGREDDVVITGDGRRISILAFNLLRGLDGVLAMQLVQRSPSSFLVRAQLTDDGGHWAGAIRGRYWFGLRAVSWARQSPGGRVRLRGEHRADSGRQGKERRPALRGPHGGECAMRAGAAKDIRPTDDGVTIRPFQDADEPRLLELLDVALGPGPSGGRSSEFFRWKHLENPFGRSLMLVAEAEGQIVGLRAFLRWRFRANDRQVLAVRAVDTATHPAFQRRGLFSRLTVAALESMQGETDLVFNTPNGRSGPGYLKMGWETVGRVPLSVLIRAPKGLVSVPPSSAARVPP